MQSVNLLKDALQQKIDGHKLMSVTIVELLYCHLKTQRKCILHKSTPIMTSTLSVIVMRPPIQTLARWSQQIYFLHYTISIFLLALLILHFPNFQTSPKTKSRSQCSTVRTQYFDDTTTL